MLTCIAMKGIFHNPDQQKTPQERKKDLDTLEKKIVLVLFLTISLDKMLTAEKISALEVDLLRERMQLFLALYRETLGIHVENQSQSGLKRYKKYHTPMHFPDLITELGSTRMNLLLWWFP